MKRNEIEVYLEQLRKGENLRELVPVAPCGKYLTRDGKTYLNLSSNDYLGLTDDSASDLGIGGRALQSEFFRSLGDEPGFLMSNPSSRLMSGNSLEYDLLEHAIAGLFPGDRKALVLTSGFLVNEGALPALTDKGDLLVADKSSHASMIDGLALCKADVLRYRHNDMNHLEALLEKNRGKYRNVWVVTESVFSMDGDRAPLREIVALKHRYDLQIFLDEAHSFGLCGAGGAGYASELGLIEQIDVITAPLGKALASTGGFVLTDALTRELLVNRMRPLIFSTALPSLNLLWSKYLIDRLGGFDARREHLRRISAAVAGRGDASQIIPILTYDSALAVAMARELREEGFWTTAIRNPTVPAGRERVRISLSASLTDEEIARFVEVRDRVKQKLGIDG